MLALEKLSQFQTLNDPQLEEMKTEAARFITAFKRGYQPRWLSLLGTSGAGKTMLAELINRICGGRFITWTSISTKLREGKYGWFTDFLLPEYLLIVDDIGSEYKTDFVVAKLYELMNARLNMWTVITANLSLEQIGLNFDPRIASRMIRHGSVVVDVDLPDWNLRRMPQ